MEAFFVTVAGLDSTFEILSKIDSTADVFPHVFYKLCIFENFLRDILYIPFRTKLQALTLRFNLAKIEIIASSVNWINLGQIPSFKQINLGQLLSNK